MGDKSPKQKKRKANQKQQTTNSAERQRPRSRRRHSQPRSERRALLITALFAKDGGSGPGLSLERSCLANNIRLEEWRPHAG
jgi:hypothetical protein